MPKNNLKTFEKTLLSSRGQIVLPKRPPRKRTNENVSNRIKKFTGTLEIKMDTAFI